MEFNLQILGQKFDLDQKTIIILRENDFDTEFAFISLNEEEIEEFPIRINQKGRLLSAVMCLNLVKEIRQVFKEIRQVFKEIRQVCMEILQQCALVTCKESYANIEMQFKEKSQQAINEYETKVEDRENKFRRFGENIKSLEEVEEFESIKRGTSVLWGLYKGKDEIHKTTIHRKGLACKHINFENKMNGL